MSSLVNAILGGGELPGGPTVRESSPLAQILGGLASQAAQARTQQRGQAQLADILESPQYQEDPNAMLAAVLRAGLGPEMTQAGIGLATGVGQARQQAIGEKQKAAQDLLGKRNLEMLKAADEQVAASSGALDSLLRLEQMNDEGITGFQVSDWARNVGLLPDDPRRAGFDAIAGEMIERYRNALGGRLNQAEFEAFSKLIPKASNSPARNRAIINALKDLESVKREEALVRQSIIANNPFEANVEALVQRQIRPAQDRAIDTIRMINESFGVINEQQEQQLEDERLKRTVAKPSAYVPQKGNVVVVRPGSDFKILEVPAEDAAKLVQGFGYVYAGNEESQDPRIF